MSGMGEGEEGIERALLNDCIFYKSCKMPSLGAVSIYGSAAGSIKSLEHVVKLRPIFVSSCLLWR